MNENIIAFLQKVTADEELQVKMQACNNPDEAYTIASSVQDGFTKEEFVEELTKLNEKITNNDSTTAESSKP